MVFNLVTNKNHFMTDNIYFLAGIEHIKKEDFKAAILSFTESLHQEPQHLASYYNRAMARQKLGEYQQSLKDYDEAINLSPQNANIYSERGVIKHLLKDNRGAIEDLNKSLQLEPDNPYRYSSRAYVRAFIGDTMGAVQDYERAIELDPQDAIALNNIGLLEERMGSKQVSEAYFKRADAIANNGKSFEKPDLEEILQKHEEKQKQKAEVERMLKQPKGTQAVASEDIPSNVGQYFRVIKSVFTSKETFGEFIAFVKNPFKKS
jgi:tetratricopeptide (TPR) repeat protein